MNLFDKSIFAGFEIYQQVGTLNQTRREFEDIHIGLKTAFENGYMAIAVYDHHYKDEELKKKYSHIYINNFKEIIEKMD